MARFVIDGWRDWRPRPAVWLASVVVLLVAGAGLLISHWPFTAERAAQSLAGLSLSRVTVRHFRPTFFPHPGFVAEQVAFHRGHSLSPPIATIRTLTVQSAWTALLLLRHDIEQVRAQGLLISIPADLPEPVRVHSTKHRENTVKELIADGAILEIARHSGPPLRFDFHRLTLGGAAKHHATSFQTAVRIPVLPGEVNASGVFGPWNGTDPGKTPLSGSFQLTQANLGVIHGIAGVLSAPGSFRGPLAGINVAGQTDVPDFEINHNRYPTRLGTNYRAVVDGLRGNVFLERVDARFLNSALTASGTVKDEAGAPGKYVSLDVDSREIYVQDLLRMFTSSPRPAMTGPIQFRAHVVLPPGDTPFLRRIGLDSRFTIQSARFTKSTTQSSLNRLSARARGQKLSGGPAHRVTSAVRARVSLRGGIAAFSHVSFSVPGAMARLAGTYSLIRRRVDFRGTVAMQATLSEANSGIKSILLKPFNRLFKRRDFGAVLPVRVTGRYPRAVFRVSLTR